MLTNGLLGAIRIVSRALERLDHAGRSLGGLGAVEAHAVHLVPVAAGDEPLLEGELAGGRPDAGCAGGRRSREGGSRARRRPR